MKTITGNRLYGLGMAVALVLSATATTASAEDMVRHLGPVGPNEPIVTTVGGKQVMAFYEANGGGCGMNILVWDRKDESGNSVARVRVTLSPREVVHIDSAENKSLNLQCGAYAEALSIVDTSNVIAAGAAQ